MRGALLLGACVAAPGAALAIFGLGSSEIRVTVRNAAPGETFVVAREFATVGKFHGSDTYCTRADATVLTSSGTAMRLPDAGTDSTAGGKAIEAFAYRRGHCLARSPDARRASSRTLPDGGMAKPPSLKPGEEADLVLLPAKQDPLERIGYLVEAAEGLLCHKARWSDRSRDAVGRMADTMLAEARSLARDPYERSLAERLGYGLFIARQMLPSDNTLDPRALKVARPGSDPLAFSRDFVVAPPGASVSFPAPGAGGMTIIGVASGTRHSATVMAGPAGAPPPPPRVVPPPEPKAPPALVVHCRLGPGKCDLDQRDVNGATALHQFVAVLRVDETRALLEAGADPSKPGKPQGARPLDTLLARMAQIRPDAPEAASARTILALLAADSRTTMSEKMKEDLFADPVSWTSRPLGAALLVAERERLRGVAAYAPAQPGCEPPGFRDTSAEGLGLRLR